MVGIIKFFTLFEIIIIKLSSIQLVDNSKSSRLNLVASKRSIIILNMSKSPQGVTHDDD